MSHDTDSPQWCQRHWREVYEQTQGPEPVNGILVSVELVKSWMTYKAKQFQARHRTLPASREGMQKLLDADAPLCCYMGNDVVRDLTSNCIVPDHFRRIADIRQRDLLHVREATGRHSLRRDRPLRGALELLHRRQLPRSVK